MSARGTPTGRLAAAVVALALLALVAAGAVTLFTGRPLRATLVSALRSHAGPSGAGGASAADTDSEGGLYRVHADPLVSYVLKPDTDRMVLNGHVHGDALGFRARPGPARGPDALHIVVAGDSVAFGFGLDDDQTVAHRLELELNAVLGPDARPVECRTVALPGWNHRNAVHAVLDHLDALAPDIVVYMPIVNDLFDTDALDESGHRRTFADPSTDDPWLYENQMTNTRVTSEAQRRLRTAGRDDSWTMTGPQVTTADIARDSSRRYDENADSIELLARVLDARGGRLLVTQFLDEDYALHLRRRLDERRLPLEVVPLFSSLPASLTLGIDPHPNADAAAAMARWIAEELLRLGWVTGAVRELSRSPEAIEAQRGKRRTAVECEGLSAHMRHAQWLRLHALIDLPSGEGCNQICGGINLDLTAGPHAQFLLPRGPLLTVRLAPIAERPDLYPLQVRVEIDGVPAGALVVPVTGQTEARFQIPELEVSADAAATIRPVEVRLVAERWGVTHAAGVSALSAYRPLWLECRAK